MKRFAEIMNGRVRVIIQGPDDWQPEFSPDSELSAIEIGADSDVAQDWLWDGTDFSEPETVPSAAIPTETLLAFFRAERERRFTETEWVRRRHADRAEMGISDRANWSAWLEYWQALRDMPARNDFDPANPQWPEPPITSEIEQSKALWQRIFG